ncbi:hypothetical protein EWM64_g6091 [Hericium alpestre]|uniref:Uncharacterized protein n=1 Tax=Hericium alpestre TaxID=135208 RepID=A0A4Y9ZV60_9AGAM|nr:hypothetical protein EWM64_g6091 [Hericium alpestre]
MGKKRSAARRATATATAASAATLSPAVPLDAHTAPVDTTTVCNAEEPLAKAPPQPCISHKADATRVPRAALPVQPTIDTSLDLEPATAEAHALMPIAIAMLQMPEHHVPDPRSKPEDSPPALTMPTSTSSNVSANSLQQLHISNHADMLSALCTPFPALSIHTATDLATVVNRAGPPNDFFAGPTHLFARANTCGREPESLAPRMSPAMSIEDVQNTMQIEAQCEVRVMALKEGQE